MIKIFYSGRFYCPTDYIYNNSTGYNQRIDENETGFLDLTIMSNNNIPISGAKVTISSVSYSGQFYEIGDGRVLYEYITDENGKTPLIELPVHNELVSNLHHHNFYIISVSADGFIDAQLYHIQIFEDQTTTFRIYLDYMFGNHKRFYIFIQPTTEEIHSR